MKERVLYNVYYQEFDDFRNAVMGFLDYISKLNIDSEFAKTFRRRVSDNFRAI